MRLKSGRIWYVPGFGEEQNEFEKWASLSGFVREQTCTPILGPGLDASILGSGRDIAVRWAETHGFPLAAQDRDNLQQVAQYVLTLQSPAYIPVAYRDALREGVLLRYKDVLPAELQQANAWSTLQLQAALKLVGESHLFATATSPYRLLARLRLPIYITASTLDFLTQALIEAGAEPVVRICPWNKWIPKEKAIYEEEPTAERPLVYHLFGHASVPNAGLVFAEDTFFDYLIGVTQNKSLIPSAVRAALSNTSLLFLGFQMSDWEFRVFFRFLMAQEGKEMLKLYSHAAAQMEQRATHCRYQACPQIPGRILRKWTASRSLGRHRGISESVMAASVGDSNPYIGPHAFQMGERIYGREHEAIQLANLIIAERVVLLHSRPGRVRLP